MQARSRQSHRAPDAASVCCERYCPGHTTLYRRQYAGTFFAMTEEAIGASLPQSIRDEFNAFFDLGSLAHSLGLVPEQLEHLTRSPWPRRGVANRLCGSPTAHFAPLHRIPIQRPDVQVLSSKASTVADESAASVRVDRMQPLVPDSVATAGRHVRTTAVAVTDFLCGACEGQFPR